MLRYRNRSVIEFIFPDNVLYVNINDDAASVATATAIDDTRVVSFAADGRVIDVTFSRADDGLVLDGLPQREEIEAALEKLASVLTQTL